jgi:hypothetical protein
VRRQFRWNPEPGHHTLRVRATDDRGNTQCDSTTWNELGYLHHSVPAHPVHVESHRSADRYLVNGQPAPGGASCAEATTTRSAPSRTLATP